MNNFEIGDTVALNVDEVLKMATSLLLHLRKVGVANPVRGHVISTPRGVQGSDGVSRDFIWVELEGLPDGGSLLLPCGFVTVEGTR